MPPLEGGHTFFKGGGGGGGGVAMLPPRGVVKYPDYTTFPKLS